MKDFLKTWLAFLALFAILAGICALVWAASLVAAWLAFVFALVIFSAFLALVAQA